MMSLFMHCWALSFLITQRRLLCQTVYVCTDQTLSPSIHQIDYVSSDQILSLYVMHPFSLFTLLDLSFLIRHKSPVPYHMSHK